jgi:hypothetical protein
MGNVTKREKKVKASKTVERKERKGKRERESVVDSLVLLSDSVEDYILPLTSGSVALESGFKAVEQQQHTSRRLPLSSIFNI